MNPEKARYYQVFLDQDLFGDWTLVKIWGGIGSNRGRMHSTGVESYEAGIELVDEIARRRSQRGYTCASPTGRS
ncbi:WGR domain-containing protein [uncultured Thiohalocapsa sp.]|uniref:WGR domain-containing protein n=1 Tax=uncultured Thiohalocapsa sp. TaxID=768990 RepID=UPI0025EF5417|nr:WGR domain-containing protein [uncultured Thiohalocapsa sp.]